MPAKQGGIDVTKGSDADVLENEVFLCTSTNRTRRSLEFLMNKISRLNIPPADTVAVEKLNLMKTHLESLLEKIEPKDNYKSNWSFNWVGVIIGLIAVCVSVLLILAVK